MAVEWYIEIEGRIAGPVDAEELNRLARTGRIGPATLVRRGREEWGPARHVRGLFDGIAEDSAPPEFGGPRDDAGPDEDYRLPPPSNGGRIAVTAFGVATLVLASLLTLGGCTSGVGSIWCFSTSNSLLQAGQQAQNPAAAGVPAAPGGGPAPAQGCGALVATVMGGVLLIVAIVLAVVMVIHLLLGGGHFAAGVGVLRRRPWARIVALILSFFTGFYGLAALYQVGSRALQSPPPVDYEAAWLALAAALGLFFVAHAVLTWVVMFHPACAQQFRASRPFSGPMV